MTDGKDRIGELFKDKTVFVTGATGFLGKVLVEKLLRVTEVKTLYLLVRQKKGRSPKDRLTDMFNHVLFSVLRKERPDSINKCVIVAGDVMETDLGISEIDRKTIENQVDFIFHSAATTRFDETLQYSVRMNALGTKYVLDLAKQCKKLKLFVHISTAFAFPKEKVLLEKTYDPPADPDEIIAKLCFGQNEISEDLARKILGDCPNTYTFSKSLAEGLVNRELAKLPIIITRPAVVVPTYKDPFPGYFNNLQSPMGIFVGAGKGVIRSVYMDSKTYANLIPADCTINAILVASYDYLTEKRQSVFNISVPQEDLKISWEEIIELGKEVVYTRVPFNGILWYPNGTMTKSKLLHIINVLLFQLVPAVFIDLLLICLGYKPILFGINQRLLKGQEMFDFYTTTTFNFSMKYFVDLRKKMNKTEKRIYMVEAENIDIKEYLENCMLYARRHIFKETDDMLPTAKRNMKIFFVLDRILKTGFFLLIVYYAFKFV